MTNKHSEKKNAQILNSLVDSLDLSGVLFLDTCLIFLPYFGITCKTMLANDELILVLRCLRYNMVISFGDNDIIEN